MLLVAVFEKMEQTLINKENKTLKAVGKIR